MSNVAPAVSPHMLPARPAAQRGESHWRLFARTAFPFLVVALAWEATAHLDVFPRKLFPPLEEVAAALLRLTADGVLPHHVLDTLVRLLAGFALAAVAGVAIGFAMGRSRRAEAAHHDAERQADGDREREPEQHAVHGKACVLQHGAVEEKRPQRARDLRQGRQQRRGKGAAARNRLVAGGGDEQRDSGAGRRDRALHRRFARRAHAIIPQRTTV